MSSTLEKKRVDQKQLQSIINQAVKKVGARKENDICRYLPSHSGGYIHHFTMRKMKGEEPDQLVNLIQKYIIHPEQPKRVPPKPRAPRGSRKFRNQVIFSKVDIERLLSMARGIGDKELIRKLAPKQDLKSIKKELIATIRHNRVEEDLWQTYCEIVQSQNSSENNPAS